MLFFSTIMLLIAAGCLLLGIYILRIDRNNRLNRLFGFICLIVSLWHIIAVTGYSSPSSNVIVTATIFASFIYLLFITANLHVGIILSLQNSPSWLITAMLYTPVFACTLFIACAPTRFFSYMRHGGGWRFSPSYESPWFHLLMVMIAAYSAAFILLLALRRKKAASNRERRQLDVIMTAFIATSVIVDLTQFIIPAFRLRAIPDIGPSGHALYLVGLYYAVFRLRFMRYGLTVSINELIAHISDMVFLTDREGSIVSMNDPAKRAIAAASAPGCTRLLFDMIQEKSLTRALFDRLSTGESQSEDIRITYLGGDGDTYTNSYVSRIMDNFSDHVGFLIISVENRGKAMLQAAYRITNREFEVIELCVRGATNREIARTLCLSVRTVEAHINNIYNKLGVDNRIELMNVAIRFGLTPGNRSLRAESGSDI